jgi:perosamine synthetase
MAKRTLPRDLTMSAPDITAHDRALVAEVLSGPHLSGGPMVVRFEDAIARTVDRRFAVAVSSGTAALHLGVRALGIGAKSRVLTTAFSFVASVNCFLYEGAEPVFADIEMSTYGLDPAAVDEVAARERIDAILPVHVFGQPCDMTRLISIAERIGCPILEDACEALGARHASRAAGSFGVAGTFAFYPNKQMTTGEGGVVVTDDERFAATCRSLRNQGRGDDGDWLTHVRLGYNYRLDAMSAALGVAQLERLDALIEARAEVAVRYSRALTGLSGLALPTLDPKTTRMSWFVYVVTLDASVDRDHVARSLAAEGVPTRPYFRPIHLQPYFRERFGDRSGSLPVTEDIGRRTLALPFHGHLSDESIGYVVEALRRAIL